MRRSLQSGVVQTPRRCGHVADGRGTCRLGSAGRNRIGKGAVFAAHLVHEVADGALHCRA